MSYDCLKRNFISSRYQEFRGLSHWERTYAYIHVVSKREYIILHIDVRTDGFNMAL